MERIPITYGEFYDYPRMIEFQRGGRWFFMRSYFDEALDDYADVYDVYLLPFQSADEVKAHPQYWSEPGGMTHLGRIPVSTVGLDETRRQSIDAGVMERWLSTCLEEAAPGHGTAR